MAKRKVIAIKNIPSRTPVLASIVYFLLLDRFNAPGWLYGVVGTMMVIFWSVALYMKFSGEEEVDIFETGTIKSKWEQKLDEMKEAAAKNKTNG